MKEPSRQSNRSTKRSNLILIRGRPLTNRCDLIWPDFRGAGIQFATTQRFAGHARERGRTPDEAAKDASLHIEGALAAQV